MPHPKQLIAIVAAALVAAFPSTAIGDTPAGDAYALRDLRTAGTGVYLATAINDRGDIAGNAVGSDGYQHGYALRGTTFALLGILPHVGAGPNHYSSATDINSDGVVVGFASNGLSSRNPYGGQHATVWRPFDPSTPSTTPFDLGAFAYGSSACNFVSGALDCYSRADGINDAGTVAGSAEIAYVAPNTCYCLNPFAIPSTRALVPGIPISADDLLPASTYIRAKGINTAGIVVMDPAPGDSSSAVLSDGTAVPFHVNSPISHPINDAKMVVGRGANGHGKLLAGGVTDLPPLPGDTSSEATAINATGDVVGMSYGGATCGQSAVLWSHTNYAVPVALDSLVPSAGWHLYEAYDINSKGQIVGGGTPAACAASANLKPYVISPATGTISGSVTSLLADPAAPVAATLHIHGTTAKGAALDLDVAATSGAYTAAIAPGDYTIAPTTPPTGEADGDWTTTVCPLTATPAGCPITLEPSAQVTASFAYAYPSVTGKIVRGADGTHPTTPESAAPNVAVDLTGTTKGGKAFTASAATGRDGRYRIATPRGTYSLSFGEGACVRGIVGCVRKSSAKTLTGDVTIDGVAVVASLVITVTPKPGKLKLSVKKGKIVPQTVTVRVSVKNVGATAVRSVRLQDAMIVGYLDPVSVPTVPIKRAGGPSPADLGTLAPGKSAKGTYKLTVKGDGRYSLEALAIGVAKSGGRVVGRGVGKLEVTAPLVLMTTHRGRNVSVPGSRRLVKAGTNFTIKIRLKNISFTKTVEIDPFTAVLEGNALDGRIGLAGGAINVPDVPVLPRPSEMAVLRPRQSLDLEAVVHTTSSQADLQNMSGHGTGGTRANVTIPTPAGHLVTEHNEIGAGLPRGAIVLDGEDSYIVSIDDRPLSVDPPPATTLSASEYFAYGVVLGAGNFFVGMAHGFKELPGLIGRGLVATPGAILAYARFEAEVWRSIQNDPAAKAAFLNVLSAQAYITYKHAQALAPAYEQFKVQVNAAAEAYFTGLANDWYAGDWASAATRVGEVAGENLVPIAGPKLASYLVRGIGPGVLATFKPALQAFASQKGALFTQFGEQLTARFPRFARALDAVSALTDAPAGAALTNTQIRQLFGLTEVQANWLRDFAKARKLLITVRSRAVESIYWLRERGAVLKPEFVKIKNVGLYDAQFLDYAEADIGRVVIRRKLPTVAQVEQRMLKARIKRDSTDWKKILERLEQRRGELTDPIGKGQVADMIEAAKAGKVKMKWNLADNAVDPTAGTAEEITYNFRIADTAGNTIPPDKLATYTATMVPEFEVGGVWRSVTGDVDFLQIMKANGTPLDDLERFQTYLAIGRGPIGLMHPESATWVLKGLFNFEKKVNEFVRAGTVLEFAPDREARAVKFLKAQFVDKLNYRTLFEGSYLTTGGPAVP